MSPTATTATTLQFSTEELVKELSKQRENFEQHLQEHEDVVKQQLPTEELVKELDKQIEHLQQHQQKYTGQVKQQSERSADMFCDDIFGESPAAISKMVSVLETSSQILGCSFLKFSLCYFLGTRSMHACYLGLLSGYIIGVRSWSIVIY